MDGPFRRVAIVGFGLIGGSIALATRKGWSRTRIVAVDRPSVIQTALQSGAADEGGEDLSACGDADLVVLAAPIQTNIHLLCELPKYVTRDALVTDVGSTKRHITDTARCLPERLQFVGGHPLAGASTGGLNAARADLFADNAWILTPADGHASGRELLTHFINGLGAHVHFMTPEAHDDAVAYLSHLPQIVASALMHVVGEKAGEDGLALAGRGLRDTTRLASSPADIWRDIAATNRDNIGPAIDDLIQVLVRMKSSQAIAETFESAARWKRILNSERDTA